MALTSTVVEEFLAAWKAVPASQRMGWRKRNEAIVVARVGVEAVGATIGELVMVVSLIVARDWNLKLVRRGEEVLRWDLTSPPARHSNPPGRPKGFAGKVRDLEHARAPMGGRTGAELRDGAESAG